MLRVEPWLCVQESLWVVVLRVDSWLCIQESLLLTYRGFLLDAGDQIQVSHVPCKHPPQYPITLAPEAASDKVSPEHCALLSESWGSHPTLSSDSQ